MPRTSRSSLRLCGLIIFFLGLLAGCRFAILTLCGVRSDTWLTTGLFAVCVASVLWFSFARHGPSIVHAIARGTTGSVLCLLAGFGFLKTVLSGYLGPGKFKREQLEAIVRKVRASELTAGGAKTFIVPDPANPVLLPSDSPRNGGYIVEAYLPAPDRLEVIILTNIQGHLGATGFAFSDVPLSAGSELHGPYTYTVEQIDEHWWSIQASD